MTLGIFEILKLVSEAPNKEKKIELLRKYNSFALRTVLQAALDPDVKWLLPEGTWPYKPCPYVGLENALCSRARELYLYVEGGNTGLNQKKREVLFTQLLEALHPEDAKLLVSVKDKKIPYKGINANMVNEAFPGLIKAYTRKVEEPVA